MKPSVFPRTYDKRIGYTLVRLICLAIILLALAMFIAGIPYRYADLQTTCSSGQETNCSGGQLTDDQARFFTAMGVSLQARANLLMSSYILIALANIALAALMVWRRPDNAFIILLAITFVAFNTDTTTPALAEAHPFWRLPVSWLSDFGSLFFPVIFYLFPNGRFVPRWTRFPVITWVCVVLVASWFRPGGEMEGFGGMVWIVVLFGSIAAQTYRYLRDSTRSEQQQIKWIVLLLAIAAIMIPVFLLFGSNVQSNPTGPKVLLLDFIDHIIGLILGVGVPLVFVLAIFYQRLWDIDVIIHRTLVYGTLTGTLLAFYFGLVISLQKIFQWVSGENQPPLATVLSTLAIAALFSPLRKRIQEAIDRRFYRRKYDAEKILAIFSASLRGEIDLDLLSERIVAVINETIQPETVSLWLREPEKRSSQPDYAFPNHV